jgi:hypothetical protein
VQNKLDCSMSYSGISCVKANVWRHSGDKLVSTQRYRIVQPDTNEGRINNRLILNHTWRNKVEHALTLFESGITSYS